jgi:hypothetical protein
MMRDFTTSTVLMRLAAIMRACGRLPRSPRNSDDDRHPDAHAPTPVKRIVTLASLPGSTDLVVLAATAPPAEPNRPVSPGSPG